eukprot:6209845-Pleurochrysis_carterae.AAC.1
MLRLVAARAGTVLDAKCQMTSQCIPKPFQEFRFWRADPHAFGCRQTCLLAPKPGPSLACIQS